MFLYVRIYVSMYACMFVSMHVCMCSKKITLYTFFSVHFVDQQYFKSFSFLQVLSFLLFLTVLPPLLLLLTLLRYSTILSFSFSKIISHSLLLLLPNHLHFFLLTLLPYPLSVLLFCSIQCDRDLIMVETETLPQISRCLYVPIVKESLT